MLALLYSLSFIYVGDLVSRQFLRYSSVKHRVATAALTGMVFASGVTYLAAVAASASKDALFWANLIYFAVVAAALAGSGFLQWKNGDRSVRYLLLGADVRNDRVRAAGDRRWDILVYAFCLVFGAWLVFATLQAKDGGFAIAVKSWSDFGPHLSLAQSMAIGNNYPTEHPFFPGEFVRYHFLFWFLSADLSYLGCNVVWAANLLSIASLLALLFLVATFAEELFDSRAVGRIAAVLFFLPATSLSWVPFMWSQSGLGGAAAAIVGLKDFVRSGFEYRGDDWGSLTVAVFSNQRQLFCAIGIVFIVLIQIWNFYRSNNAVEDLKPLGQSGPEAPDETESEYVRPDRRTDAAALAYCGVLIGLLPYWNSAIFVAASLVIGSLLVLFPLRKYLVVCMVAAAVVGLPQIMLLRSGNVGSTAASMFQWGYLVPEPTLVRVLVYFVWTFGFKLVFLAVAAALVPSSHRRLMIALTTPAIVVFLLKLSTDIFNNHKLLNFWNVALSVFVAYAIWRLAKKGFPQAILAAALTLAMTFGAVIDLFPVHNDSFVFVPHKDDRLTEWLLANTRPDDIFLSDTLISHPILFSGRRVYLGNTLFAWTSGYDLAPRESAYRLMLTTQDMSELRLLLARTGIAYAAFDDGVRENPSLNGANETLFRQHFPIVYDDKENKHRHITIYRISEPLSP